MRRSIRNAIRSIKLHPPSLVQQIPAHFLIHQARVFLAEGHKNYVPPSPAFFAETEQDLLARLVPRAIQVTRNAQLPIADALDGGCGPDYQSLIRLSVMSGSNQY